MPEQLSLGGPYLGFAVICERVLTETDGVISLIRIVDRFTVRGPTESMPPTPLSMWIAIMLKAGIYRGLAIISVQPVSPSGNRLAALTQPVHFDGDDDRGVLLALQTQFLAEEAGLYWFDVTVLEQLVTRIPLRVVYLPMVTTPGGGTAAERPPW